MQETGAGVVINIASANAFFTIPQNTAYAGAKAGIVGLTRGLALELGPQNIRVLSISPGLIATPAIREYVAALILKTGNRNGPLRRADSFTPNWPAGRSCQSVRISRIGQGCIHSRHRHQLRRWDVGAQQSLLLHALT